MERNEASNPRRKLPLTWRGFGCGCTMEADTRKTAVKDAAGAAQRAKILDGRIFPSPAPRKVPERGLFTWSGSRGKNPRRKLPLTWRGFGSGCILCSTPAKRLSRTRQRRLCRSEILDGRIFPSTAPHSKKKMAFLPSFFTAN